MPQSSAQVKLHTMATEEANWGASEKSEQCGRRFWKLWETTGTVEIAEVTGWIREGESDCVHRYRKGKRLWPSNLVLLQVSQY